MTFPTATAVICAYTIERRELLIGAITSALAQDVAPLEVLVVIDHNDDLQAQLTASFEHEPMVRVVASTGAPGLSGARNTGAAMAKGDVLAFLDDDAFAEPAWLQGLIAPFAADDNVMATGGLVEPVWDPSAPDWFPEEYLWVVGCTYRGAPREPVEIRNPIGCNMAIRRSAVAVVGGFMEGVGRIGNHLLGCEETLFCIELRQKVPTARIRFAPGARVTHHVAADRHRPRYFRRRCYAEGLSKAMVTARVGKDGLASERSYVLRTLPAGVVTGLRDSVRERSSAGVRRAVMIVLGLVAAGSGYVMGKGALVKVRW